MTNGPDQPESLIAGVYEDEDEACESIFRRAGASLGPPLAPDAEPQHLTLIGMQRAAALIRHQMADDQLGVQLILDDTLAEGDFALVALISSLASLAGDALDVSIGRIAALRFLQEIAEKSAAMDADGA